MDLYDLEVYKLAREISKECWDLYNRFDWHTKKIIGDQWIKAADSIGANIAEGFGRYHFLDKNKFNYNARGSLVESIHWTDTLIERNIIEKTTGERIIKNLNLLCIKLNNYITATQKQKQAQL